MSFKRHKYLWLLFACIGTRLLSSIFYIEDIDSLRFGLAVYDYDVASLRPHFPGYPLYCFLLKGVHSLTGSLGLSFSLLGGFSIYISILFTEKIWRLFSKRDSFNVILITFFCPLLWLMSNRYMPDIMGLSILLAAFYYLIVFSMKKTDLSGILCCVLLGALAGVRLSFVPFFLPGIYVFLRQPRKIPKMLLFFMLSIGLWFVPWLIDTGWDALMTAAKFNTDGHFNKWGGGVLSDNSSYVRRFYKMLESIWADGLGAWWWHRHWSTAIVGISWMFIIYLGFRSFVARFRRIYKDTYILILLCLLSYSIWAYFFQNIASKPRHILPLLPFIILLGSIGISEIQKVWQKRIQSVFSLVFFSSIVFVCIVLVRQHQTPSAISQLSSYVLKQDHPTAVFYSKPLINYYLSRHIGLEDMAYISEEDEEQLLGSYVAQGTKIFSTVAIDSSKIPGFTELSKTNFYHNPYVNRLWYHMHIYTYSK